jgi:DNA-binding NtrC family response regulator
VAEGKFRQDLFFRLNVIPLRLPSLKERGDDALVLARFFMDLYAREYKLPPASLSGEAEAWLLGYDWPGNVRELQNLMERAVLLCGGRPVKPAHFLLEADSWPLFGGEEDVPAPAGSDSAAPEAAGPAGGEEIAPSAAGSFSGALIPLHEMERLMIIKGLEHTQGNRTQAAELLGISVRTLRNKLNEYREQGLPIE